MQVLSLFLRSQCKEQIILCLDLNIVYIQRNWKTILYRIHSLYKIVLPICIRFVCQFENNNRQRVPLKRGGKGKIYNKLNCKLLSKEKCKNDQKNNISHLSSIFGRFLKEVFDNIEC